VATIPAIVFGQPGAGTPYVRPVTGAFSFVGPWSISGNYNSFDVVTDGGSVWVARLPNAGVVPSSRPDLWGLMVPASAGVSSVGLTAPGVFSVSGSPVTNSGNLALSLAVQNAAKVWAGPVSGADATPTFRVLASSDQPNYTFNKQTGTSYTVVAADRAGLLTFSNASPVAVTLPQATGTFGIGFYLECENVGVGL
jgi:hypothetical protein